MKGFTGVAKSSPKILSRGFVVQDGEERKIGLKGQQPCTLDENVLIYALWN